MKIHIVEECWGINHRTGIRCNTQTDEKVFDPIVGIDMIMPIGRRKFIVDAVDDIGVTVTVHYENNPSANKTWTIAKGESVNYRPMSVDGGYKYTITYKDEG